MKIAIAEFARLSEPVPVTIHSLDLALYQVILVLNGKSRLLTYDDGRPYRARTPIQGAQ